MVDIVEIVNPHLRASNRKFSAANNGVVKRRQSLQEQRSPRQLGRSATKATGQDTTVHRKNIYRRIHVVEWAEDASDYT